MHQGTVGIFNFFKVRELSGKFILCQGKMKFCQMSGNCQGILHFSHEVKERKRFSFSK